MKKIKRLIALAISMALGVTIFAGCGGSEETTNNSGKKDVVTVWTYPQYKPEPTIKRKGYEDLLKELIEKYKKTHPNVEVKYEILSWDEGDQKFDIALNAGTPPDLFYTISQSKYLKTGLAMPIDKYLTEPEKKDFESFAINRYKIDGKQYGLPTWISVHCLAGERNLFKDAGINYKKIIKDGWTWDEFQKDIKKIVEVEKKNNKKIYGFLTEGKTKEMFERFLISDGLGTGIDQEGKYQFVGNGVVETLDFFKKLINEGLIPKETAGIDNQKCEDMFNEGKAAVFGRVGPYILNFNNNRNENIEVKKIKGEKRDIILLPFPHSSKGKNFVFGECGGYMTFRQKKAKGEEHEKNVADLLKMLTSTDSAIASSSLFTTPARVSGQKLIKGKIKTDDENLEFMENAIKIIKAKPIVSPEIDSKLNKVDKEAITPLWQAFLAGEKTPVQVEKGISNKAKELFNK